MAFALNLSRRRPLYDGHGPKRRRAIDRKGMDRMMRNRRHTLLWMKDLLDHMNQCHEQLQWAADGPTEAYLAETLMVDLSECQKLCEQLKPSHRKAQSMAASA
jgi:hypothetical protein